MKYRSAVDPFIGITIAITVIILLYSIYDTIKNTGVFHFVIVLTFILSIVFCISILIGTSYTIKNNELIIRCCFIPSKIKIEDIYEVKKITSYIGSPSLSKNKLQIFTNNKTIYISPSNMTEFENNLKSQNPNIVVN